MGLDGHIETILEQMYSAKQELSDDDFEELKTAITDEMNKM